MEKISFAGTNVTTTESVLVQQIIPSMVLAPSAHNTQPWRFKAQENSVEIFVNWDRHLTISDPTHRQLFVSIGCAVANGIVAGGYWGYKVAVHYFPEGQNENSPVGRLVFTPAASVSTKETASALFSAIEKRRTNRAIYDAKPLTAIEKKALKTEESAVMIEDKKVLEKIAKLTAEGTVATLSRRDFKQELSQWVRNNWTRQNDGMPGYAMGVPAPISLLGSLMVRFAPIHKQEGPKAYEQISSASAVVLLCTAADTPTDWMQAGAALENVWLQSTVADLAAAPVVSAIEASADLRKHLQQAAGTSLLPQSLIRIGHSSTTPLRHTPRRSLEDCLK